MRQEDEIDPGKLKKILIGIVAAIFLIVAIPMSYKMAEQVNANEIVVIQDPIDGELHVHIGNTSTGGLVWQNFGTATHYKKSFQYWFSKDPKDGSKQDESIKVRFNDGGHAQLSGSIRVDLPLAPKSIIDLHSKYYSQDAIENQLMKQLITKAVYMTGPMMSSKESYAERRNDLMSLIEDQAVNGVYKTQTTNVKVKDAMDTLNERTVAVVQPKLDISGNPMREEESPAKRFSIKLYNLSINSIDYDNTVEKQIQNQQQAIMQVQTAIAKAKQAEQEKYTVEQQGQADAAKAKWEQEVVKAQQVTKAEQELAVQVLNTKKAAEYKQQQILEGEGDAAKKRLVMQANGALEQKLEAWKFAQEKWAAAFAAYQGNIVPQVQTGNGTGTTNGATQFMEMMGIKAARDLSLDFKNK